MSPVERIKNAIAMSFLHYGIIVIVAAMFVFTIKSPLAFYIMIFGFIGVTVNYILYILPDRFVDKNWYVMISSVFMIIIYPMVKFLLWIITRINEKCNGLHGGH